MWKHFKKNKIAKKALCNHCLQVLQTQHGTSVLINHLKSKHKIDILKFPNPSTSKASTKNDQVVTNPKIAPTLSMKSIAEYCQEKKSLGEVIARLVAVDNFNFKYVYN